MECTHLSSMHVEAERLGRPLSEGDRKWLPQGASASHGSCLVSRHGLFGQLSSSLLLRVPLRVLSLSIFAFSYKKAWEPGP